MVTGGFVNVPGTSNYVGADWAHTFNDHFLNQARYSYSRSTTILKPAASPAAPAQPSSPVARSAWILTMVKLSPWARTHLGRKAGLCEVTKYRTMPPGRPANTFSSWAANSTITRERYGTANVNGDLRFDNFGAFINTPPTVTLYAEGPAAYNLVFNYGRSTCRTTGKPAKTSP